MKHEFERSHYKEVSRPDEIPEQAERYGEYYVRLSKQLGQKFYFHEGKWYIHINYMNEEEKAHLSYPTWSAYEGYPVRLFSSEESVVIKRFMRDGLLTYKDRIVDVFYAWVHYSLLNNRRNRLEKFRVKKRLKAYKEKLGIK
jgi:hypothetical protein